MFVVKKMHSFQLLHLLIHIWLTTTLIESKFFNNPQCNEWCGDVRIHYPFGIGRNCAANKWYTIDCNSSTPYLPALNNVEVLELSLSMLVVTVNMSVIKADCKNPVTSTTHGNNPFRFSRLDNTLVFEGCGKCVMMDENRNIVSGCSTTCGKDTVGDINNCSGVGCCPSTIPRDLKSFTLNVTGLERDEPCSGSAFLVNGYYARRFSSDFHVKDHSFFPISLSWKENLTESRRCAEYGISKKSLGVILGVSIIMGLLFLMAISYVFCQINTKRKLIKMKQMYFKRNGGLLLKHRQETDSGLVDNTILFTSNELEKATDHFNENRILGRGGQGTVYKGMLVDGRIVAIKKSKVIDERHIQQFINEVIILSQVNHRNVVKLLGCCLETEVPLLVSEFISNGTLYDFLQDETSEISISLNMRLQIATEVAGAISYLHSATSIPIYHRDVKTTNILLDEKYRAKVSDFGTSRSVSVDQTHVTTIVKGTFGYLDPEYFQSNQFTEKSDVYSFGVVLLELLTREKPISSTRFGENRFLATHFLLAMEEGRVMSIFDPLIVNDDSRGDLLVLANLAMRCLNSKGRNRPTMKEVGFELEGIRLSHKPSTVQTTFSDDKKSKDVPQMFCESTSTSLTFDDDLCR